MTNDVDNANVRFPPPLIYLGFLLIGVWMGQWLHLPRFDLGDTARNLLGWILTGIGVLVGPVAGAGLFRLRGTAIIPVKPASRLVTSGIYRWTRNPMYLGLALIYAGVAILFDSLLALLLLIVVVAVIQTYAIAREEAYLDRTFGDEYRAYKSRVRRWI